jgi:4-aminobutyrate aminotransferase-like enzyme
MELAGARNNVIKFLAPLIIPDDVLIEGLDILEAAIGAVLKNR